MAIGTTSHNLIEATPAELKAAESFALVIRAAVIDCRPSSWSAQIREQIDELRHLTEHARLNEATPDFIAGSLAARLNVPELTRHVPKGFSVGRVMYEACKMLRDELLLVVNRGSRPNTRCDVRLPECRESTVFPFPIQVLTTPLQHLAARCEGEKRNFLECVSGYRVLDLLQIDRDTEWAGPGEKRAIPHIMEMLGKLSPALQLLFATTSELGLTRPKCNKLRTVKVPLCEVRGDRLCAMRSSERAPVLNGWGVFLMSKQQVEEFIGSADRLMVARQFQQAGFKPRV